MFTRLHPKVADCPKYGSIYNRFIFDDETFSAIASYLRRNAELKAIKLFLLIESYGTHLFSIYLDAPISIKPLKREKNRKTVPDYIKYYILAQYVCRQLPDSIQASTKTNARAMHFHGVCS